MVISKFKRLYSKDETVQDAGETSTAVSVYEPKSISSARRRQSSDYQKSREYRGSNLSSGSRRAIESKGNTKSADNIIDAKYEDVDENYYSKPTQVSTGSRKLKDILHDEPPVQEEEVPVMKSPAKRPSTKAPSKRPSETSTQKSPKKRVVDAKAPEPDFNLDEQKRIWSRYGRVEDETYKKVKDAREDAEYSLGLKKAKTRGQQRGIDLDDVEELAYQAEANRRETEQLKEDVRKAQERGINRATPFPEKIAKAEKAAGKAIGAGFKEINKATATFAQSRMGKNITKANEATLRGMKEAGDRVRGSIGAGRKNLTPSALNKPRTFRTGTTTNPAPKITTRTIRRGKNNVVLYFDEYGRQIPAAAARAYMAGKIPAQKPVANLSIPVANVNQRTATPFAVGRPQNPLGDLWNHGIPFAAGHYTPPFASGNHQAPFVAGVYQFPFVPGSKPTLVVSGYDGNPIGDIRRSGNPLGDIRWIYGNPLRASRREGNPLGTIRREGNPLGEMIKVGNPLGDDERRGHTSRILRGQVQKKVPRQRGAKRLDT